MTYKDDILNYLKEHPNVWIDRVELYEKTKVPIDNMSKATNMLVKWNERVEKRELKNPSRGNKVIVQFKYRGD